MSASVVGTNKVYTSINDLPENINISDGDRYIVQTLDGDTVLVDYASIKIDLDHTTFGAQYLDMVEFTQRATEWVTRITSEFESIEDQFTQMKQSSANLQQTVEALMVIIKLILGYKNAYAQDSIDEWVNGQLGDYAKTVYAQIMENTDPTFSFAQNNLLRIY